MQIKKLSIFNFQFSTLLGQSLVELLIAIAFAGLLLPALLTGFVTSRSSKAQDLERNDALLILQEVDEAVRLIRENDWNAFAINGTFHPQLTGGTWSLVSGTDVANGFTRQLVINDVLRDTSGTIIASGGTIDPGTKKITTTISWTTPYASSVSSDIYLSRFVGNTTFMQTTQSEFNAGTKTGVTVTNTNGGEVVLGAGGQGNWCTPNLSIAALDLPKSGVANAITAIEGRVFAGTGDNASGVSFADVAISNANPPAASIQATFDGYKTNSVFGEENYAYLGTDNNSREVVILNTSSIPYTEVGHVNVPGNGQGDSIFVKGTIGYVISKNALYSFDLSDKTGSRTLLDSDGITLFANGVKVVVVGNYAYVVLANNTKQLQIIDVSNPANLTIVGDAVVNGLEGKDVFVNTTGNRAYLVTALSATQPEFFILDTTSKNGSHSALSSYDTTDMNPKGVTVVSGNKAIVVGTSGEEYQVIDITSESSLTRCGGLQVANGINGIASIVEADGDAYSYILTGDASSELKIIEGGPGGSFATSGVLESAVFDASKSAQFNRFIVTASKPTNTTLTYQVSVADAVNNSCTGVTFDFVGPNASSSSYFTDNSGTFPYGNNGSGYKNPGQCFKYRAYLSTTDSTQTPVLEDFTVNYSP